jgi:SAM-dependent methyltransferase
MSDYQYQGEELDLFNHAVRWKRYWGSRISPWVKGRVLDIGAGQGNNLPVLLDGRCTAWTALEPDAALLARTARLGPVAEDPRVRLVAGDATTLLDAGEEASFDTIVYIDVMEHIDDDLGEFRRAARLLAPGGHLIILSPAFQFLYSPFDKAIGHCRRYHRSTLKRLQADDVSLQDIYFLDSAGFLLSSANRWLLKQSMPTVGQIKFWDSKVIPISRATDCLLGACFGRSIVGVWQKADAASTTRA